MSLSLCLLVSAEQLVNAKFQYEFEPEAGGQVTIKCKVNTRKKPKRFDKWLHSLRRRKSNPSIPTALTRKSTSDLAYRDSGVSSFASEYLETLDTFDGHDKPSSSSSSSPYYMDRITTPALSPISRRKRCVSCGSLREPCLDGDEEIRYTNITEDRNVVANDGDHSAGYVSRNEFAILCDRLNEMNHVYDDVYESPLPGNKVPGNTLQQHSNVMHAGNLMQQHGNAMHAGNPLQQQGNAMHAGNPLQQHGNVLAASNTRLRASNNSISIASICEESASESEAKQDLHSTPYYVKINRDPDPVLYERSPQSTDRSSIAIINAQAGSTAADITDDAYGKRTNDSSSLYNAKMNPPPISPAQINPPQSNLPRYNPPQINPPQINQLQINPPSSPWKCPTRWKKFVDLRETNICIDQRVATGGVKVLEIGNHIVMCNAPRDHQEEDFQCDRRPRDDRMSCDSHEALMRGTGMFGRQIDSSPRYPYSNIRVKPREDDPLVTCEASRNPHDYKNETVFSQHYANIGAKERANPLVTCQIAPDPQEGVLRRKSKIRGERETATSQHYANLGVKDRADPLATRQRSRDQEDDDIYEVYTYNTDNDKNDSKITTKSATSGVGLNATCSDPRNYPQRLQGEKYCNRTMLASSNMTAQSQSRTTCGDDRFLQPMNTQNISEISQDFRKAKKNYVTFTKTSSQEMPVYSNCTALMKGIDDVESFVNSNAFDFSAFADCTETCV